MLTGDELVDIYMIFAEVQELDTAGEDFDFLRGRGFERLRRTGHVDYKPLDGVRFSVTCVGDNVECTGYGIGVGQGLRSKEFKDKVAEYLATRKA